jgi:hypothetical protein
MAEQARSTVIDSLDHENGEIEYVEEAFTW